MPWLQRILIMTLAVAPVGGLAQNRQVDFTEEHLEGARQNSELGFVLERRSPEFRCDITRLALEEYNRCFEAQLAEQCGTQLIERDRFELQRIGFVNAQGPGSKTVAAAFPHSLHLDRGVMMAQEATVEEGWNEAQLLLQNQSPVIDDIDAFVSTRTSFILADRSGKRVFVVPKMGSNDHPPSFRKIELSGRNLSLLGVLNNGSYVTRGTQSIFKMNLSGRNVVPLKVPVEDYTVDPRLDAQANLLLVSKATSGHVYLVSSRGQLRGTFPRDPQYRYSLLPSGVIAAANFSTGQIKIQSRTGVVLSRTNLRRPLRGFGVLGQRDGTADLYYVADDGIGVLYPDGFEKSFLAKDTRGLRVLDGVNDGTLSAVVTGASRKDPSRSIERTVEFYALGSGRSRITRVVEGVCPSALEMEQQALRLKSPLKASWINGQFVQYR